MKSWEIDGFWSNTHCEEVGDDGSVKEGAKKNGILGIK